MTQNKKEEIISKNVPEAEKQGTVGDLLRRTRQAKKQDLRDIASYLCIRYQFLEALEENRYKDLPGEAYAIGFIRSYAAYLGLDSADIIVRYKQELFAQGKEGKRSPEVSEEETENVTPAPKVLFISLILLLAAYGVWQSESKEKDVLPVAEAPIESVTVVEHSYPLPQEETPVEAVSNETTEAPAVPPVPPVKPEYQAEETVSPDAAASAVVSEPQQPAETESQSEAVPTVHVYGQKNQNARLVLVAVEETWVEVTRNGAILISRLLNKGDRYQVSSYKPEELLLKTGNAGGLEVYCDGLLTQPLGPRGALRSNITLIPDEFAAKVVENME